VKLNTSRREQRTSPTVPHGARCVAERTEALLGRPEVRYLLVFENRGAEVGATISHPHGQIYAYPFVPPVPAREAEVAAEHACALCTPPAEELVFTSAEGWCGHVPFASAGRTRR
jgi:UDPglucose--hexose-1-phosphate uridylyltransferase